MDFITTKFYSENSHAKISNKISEILIKKALSSLFFPTFDVSWATPLLVHAVSNYLLRPLKWDTYCMLMWREGVYKKSLHKHFVSCLLHVLRTYNKYTYVYENFLDFHHYIDASFVIHTIPAAIKGLPTIKNSCFCPHKKTHKTCALAWFLRGRPLIESYLYWQE